ncbi:REP-associated tyrosine transposase [Chryseolinea lacunae]|uniref:Transposase n=1 Tax=Chryseolinea lacunae TaxID=2801331 RepID=A0ABS1KRA8_9BACT|nr:transposase [Chryseolinea lacunae]MBL0741232.1 transposase [Chryseolinea lacunae]
MSRKYKIRNQDKLYFVTFTVIQWLDVFTRTVYKDILLDSIRYCQKAKGLEIWAYCIMTNHAHFIMGRNGTMALEHIIRDLKKFTAKRIVEAIENNPQESRRELFLWLFRKAGKYNPNNENIQFWQQGSHAVELSTNHMLDQRLDYIHNNPVKAGIVLSPEHYLYSSAINYAGLPEKLLDVMLI